MVNVDRRSAAPELRMLDAEGVETLRQGALEVLARTGVRVGHPEALELLAAAGAEIVGSDIARLPAPVVEDALSSAPSRVVVYNRRGEPVLNLEGRRTHFGPGTDLAWTWDLDDGGLRPSRLEDAARAARLVDALDDLDFCASYALPRDTPVNLSGFESFRAMLSNTVKPLFFTAAGRQDLALIHEAAALAAGGREALAARPFIIHYAEPLSPLQHTRGALDKLLYCADHSLPVVYAPGLMSGASAPATLAGALVQGAAEALSGLTIHQLRRPGAPIISGVGTSTLDMKTSACIYGCPEYRLAMAACADLYHHLRLPVWGTAGVTDAVFPDQQAGMEWSASIMNDLLAGANLVHDVGYLGQGLVGHPAALVMCAEIISYMKRYLAGFSLDASHLALEVIDRVGPGGQYLADQHTFEHFREEHWRPGLTNRFPPEVWLEKGRQNWADLTTDRARKILAEHRPEPLSPEIRAALDELALRAKTELERAVFPA